MYDQNIDHKLVRAIKAKKAIIMFNRRTGKLTGIDFYQTKSMARQALKSYERYNGAHGDLCDIRYMTLSDLAV